MPTLTMLPLIIFQLEASLSVCMFYAVEGSSTQTKSTIVIPSRLKNNYEDLELIQLHMICAHILSLSLF